MNHGRHDKVQCMLSGRESLSLFYNDLLPFQIKTEELVDHGESLRVADDLYIRIAQDEFFDHGTVIRFHMVDNKVVKAASVKNCLDILKELAPDCIIRRIEQNRLLIHQKIGVVGYSVFEREDVLKQFDSAVAASDPVQIFRYFSETVH